MMFFKTHLLQAFPCMRQFATQNLIRSDHERGWTEIMSDNVNLGNVTFHCICHMTACLITNEMKPRGGEERRKKIHEWKNFTSRVFDLSFGHVPGSYWDENLFIPMRVGKGEKWSFYDRLKCLGIPQNCVKSAKKINFSSSWNHTQNFEIFFRIPDSKSFKKKFTLILTLLVLTRSKFMTFHDSLQM